ncbi:Phosphomutase-like protein 3 [Echria macrotheca]|uniref:Phosphomutase-like protein 3 n=1 Tax=Echria macrotheca TaxID=438768 RepID=A0AAJ0FFG0_9PEZI|nr:Phosphomutase-like protein 3 [Echria macrotheca]
MRVLPLVLTAPLLAFQGCVAASFRYSVDKTGLFLQEDPKINPNPPSYADTNFGLLNRTYETDASFDPSGQKTQWERFANYVAGLNKDAAPGVSYKVLYMARHGEGYHNVAQTFYGADCWECYWSQQTGNGTTTWQDAELTPKGYAQVRAANAFWRDTALTSKIPFPQSFYVSPMARCLATANETFATLGVWDGSRGFAPVVKELLRETLNACTCSWRHPKSWIHARFPTYRFEPDFSEDDVLFRPGIVTEYANSTAQRVRVRRLLDDVFTGDNSTYISFSTHGVVISPILEVIGYPNAGFSLGTGQVIPVLVRAEKVSDGPGGEAVVGGPVAAKACGVCGPAGGK